MPTETPRSNVLVDESVYQTIRDLATKEGVSMSSLTQDLIREALEIREDVALARRADNGGSTWA